MTLQAGDNAPNFTLPAANGETISLSDFKGQIVVLYFYPKDDTPGCTTQACGFRDNFNSLKSQGIQVIGLSKDSVKSHEKFREKFQLNFPLVSDESLETLKAFESWIEKSMYGKKYMGIDRSTFLIDENGKLAHIWRNVKIPGHMEEVINAAQALKEQKAA